MKKHLQRKYIFALIGLSFFVLIFNTLENKSAFASWNEYIAPDEKPATQVAKKDCKKSNNIVASPKLRVYKPTPIREVKVIPYVPGVTEYGPLVDTPEHCLTEFDITYRFVDEKKTEVAIGLKSNAFLLSTITVPRTMYIDGRVCSVVAIDREGFKDCSWLNKIRIADTVRFIGVDAFANCENLHTVMILGKVTLSVGAFYDCSKLNGVYFSDDIIELKDEVFLGCKNLETFVYYGNNKPICGEDVFDSSCKLFISVRGKCDYEELAGVKVFSLNHI